MSLPEITVQELEAMKNAGDTFFLLDVRNPDEYATANLGGHLIPLNELPMRLNELKRDDMIVVHCQGGGRSSRACEYLLQQGFTNVHNLRGGLTAWQREIG
ncbi:MAG: rhodanese-like domain-containing protein [Gammaproteobacteria bacterium]|nr:rhodanese-like domain-containing protein [Gammaproteobacteria bacterium]